MYAYINDWQHKNRKAACPWKESSTAGDLNYESHKSYNKKQCVSIHASDITDHIPKPPENR